MTGEPTAVRVAGLSKRYRLGLSHSDTLAGWLSDVTGRFRGGGLSNLSGASSGPSGSIWALRDVDLVVRRGEVVGLIGANGAGKSTLLKILTRITPPTAGEVDLVGTVTGLLEIGTGFHPEMTGRENIRMNAALLGMGDTELSGRLDEIVGFAGVEGFLDTPVKRYSSGMQVRLGFAVAAHLNPDILIIDEVLAVGDAEFQRKCLGKMRDVATRGRTVIFVSHNLSLVRQLCDRVVWFNAGRVCGDGPPATIIADYLAAAVGSDGDIPSVRLPDSDGGDRPVRITSVRVVDASGECRSGLDLRDPIGFEVGVVAGVAVSKFRVGVLVHTDEGVEVFGSNEVFGVDEERRGGQPGGGFIETKVVCELPGWSLNDGTYSLSVDVGLPPFVESAVRHDHLLSFRLVDSVGHGAAAARLPGILRPKLTWRSVGEDDVS